MGIPLKSEVCSSRGGGVGALQGLLPHRLGSVCPSAETRGSWSEGFDAGVPLGPPWS